MLHRSDCRACRALIVALQAGQLVHHSSRNFARLTPISSPRGLWILIARGSGLSASNTAGNRRRHSARSSTRRAMCPAPGDAAEPAGALVGGAGYSDLGGVDRDGRCRVPVNIGRSARLRRWFRSLGFPFFGTSEIAVSRAAPSTRLVTRAPIIGSERRVSPNIKAFGSRSRSASDASVRRDGGTLLSSTRCSSDALWLSRSLPVAGDPVATDPKVRFGRNLRLDDFLAVGRCTG